VTPSSSFLLPIALAAAVLTTAGCSTPTRTPAPAHSSAAAVKPPASQPTFADPLSDSTTSVVKLYSYDAAAGSAVVEPIIFMDGPAFCKAFKLKSSDPRCEREWTTEESHTKITVPVVPDPKLTTWDDHKGGDCIGSMTTGGTCATSASEFAKWLKGNPEGFAVITTKDGMITKIAQMFIP